MTILQVGLGIGLGLVSGPGSGSGSGLCLHTGGLAARLRPLLEGWGSSGVRDRVRDRVRVRVINGHRQDHGYVCIYCYGKGQWQQHLVSISAMYEGRQSVGSHNCKFVVILLGDVSRPSLGLRLRFQAATGTTVAR